jgi:hypothetical protein
MYEPCLEIYPGGIRFFFWKSVHFLSMNLYALQTEKMASQQN